VSLAIAGIKPTNRISFLEYNVPFEVLNSKNEIIVELEGMGLD